MTIDQMEQTIHDLTVERDGLLEAAKAAGGGGAVIVQLRADLATANDRVTDLSNNYAALTVETDEKLVALRQEIKDRDAVTASDKALITELQGKVAELEKSLVGDAV